MSSKLLSPLIVALMSTAGIAADWTFWGGPARDFQVRTPDPLADAWPAGGPPVLWKRTLGDGYSAIAVSGSTLYTMYRRQVPVWQFFTPDQEVVVALDAATGKTRWEFAYDEPFVPVQGPGPRAMPQVAGDLVFSVGVNGKLHALNARTGASVWTRDLYQEFGGTHVSFGYASHPLLYGGNLIVAIGGKGKAVAALDQKSGRTVWAANSFTNAYSSPVLVNAGGRDQVVIVAAQNVLGIDPRDGILLWSLSLSTDPGMAFCTTPLWDAASQTVVFAGAYGFGTSAVRLIADGTGTRAEPLWHNPRLQLLFGNFLLAGDTLYLSRGYAGPAFLTAADLKTGTAKWSTREFGRASFLGADGKLILLDEDGVLALARPNPGGSLHVLAKAQVLSGNAWTLPTLAGRALYLRDRRVITALDLGKR